MKPESTLNSVVLPAPFGPISAVIDPRSTASETSFTATRPLKRFVTLSARRMGASGFKGVFPLVAEEPLRPPDHQDDQRQADEDQAQERPVAGGEKRERPEIEEPRARKDDGKAIAPIGTAHTFVLPPRMTMTKA